MYSKFDFYLNKMKNEPINVNKEIGKKLKEKINKKRSNNQKGGSDNKIFKDDYHYLFDGRTKINRNEFERFENYIKKEYSSLKIPRNKLKKLYLLSL